METNVNYTAVGAFVITLTSFMILAIIWLSAGLSINEYTTYRVYMTESVSGLSKDSTVEFNGVTVGQVKSIEINPENPQMVDLLLDIRKETPITQGTLAMLSSRGLTGITLIALQDKGENKEPLVTLPGQEYPIIATKPSLLLRLDMALSKASDSLYEVSKSVRTLLDQENLRTFKEILANMKNFTNMLSVNSRNMNMIFSNTARASEHLAPAMKTLSNETLPQANQAVQNISDLTQNLDVLSAEMKQNPAILIRGSAPRVPGPGE